MSSTDRVRVEKLMALTLGEFQLTIAPLIGGPLRSGLDTVAVPVGTGSVAISCEPRPGVRLGGLLDVPRALVSLTFSGVSAADQAAFLATFDLAFRRGGG